MSKIPNLDIKDVSKSSSQVFNELIPTEIETWDLSKIKIEPDNTNKIYKKVKTQLCTKLHSKNLRIFFAISKPVFDFTNDSDGDDTNCEKEFEVQFLDLVKPVFNKQIFKQDKYVFKYGFKFVKSEHLRPGYFASNRFDKQRF